MQSMFIHRPQSSGNMYMMLCSSFELAVLNLSFLRHMDWGVGVIPIRPLCLDSLPVAEEKGLSLIYLLSLLLYIYCSKVTFYLFSFLFMFFVHQSLQMDRRKKG